MIPEVYREKEISGKSNSKKKSLEAKANGVERRLEAQENSPFSIRRIKHSLHLHLYSFLIS